MSRLRMAPACQQVEADYPASLESAWAAHLAPRAAGAPTVVSLFAGCGGSSLGYSMAGYDERLAVEWDANAVVCLRLNFPDLHVWQGDVAQLAGDKALGLAGLDEGELDVLDGSPPCQGFSTAGRRVMDDPRNGLFREFVRLLRAFRPKAFVMENVSGMVKGKMRLVFAEILGELKAAGYAVAVRLLNAAAYGVPQSRQRVIFIGMREDLGVSPTHPLAETWPVPVRVALRGLSAERLAECLQRELPNGKLNLAERWKNIAVGGNLSDLHESGSYFSNMLKLDPDRPAPTFVKTVSDSTCASFVHWAEPRYIATVEAQRLTSFPDAFKLKGTYSDRMARIGNSVPPLMMRAISRHIRALLESAAAARFAHAG